MSTKHANLEGSDGRVFCSETVPEQEEQHPRDSNRGCYSIAVMSPPVEHSITLRFEPTTQNNHSTSQSTRTFRTRVSTMGSALFLEGSAVSLAQCFRLCEILYRVLARGPARSYCMGWGGGACKL